MNLGGMPFQIDDEAFEKLNAYLKAVKRKFSHVQGNEEIVEDIEARMAEMFQDNLDATATKIVSIKDVDGAIEAMGRPEEFEQGFDEDDVIGGPNGSSKSYTVGKKLFRDTDDRIIGGVISGITKYFGFESPKLLRIIFVIIPFLDIFFWGAVTGTLIFIYAILWIVLPKAVSATQKMQMRGEPVNLDNIEKNFSDGYQTVKKNFNQDSTRRDLGDVLGTIVVAVGKILLAFALFVVGMIMIAIIIGLLGSALGLGIAAPFAANTILGNSWIGWTLTIGALLMLLAFPVFLISLFTKLLFKTKTNMPAIAFGTLGAFILGLILTTFSGFNLSKEFSNSSTVRETAELIPASEFYLYGSDDSDWDDDNFTIGFDESILKENVDLKIINTKDSLPSLIIKKKARGRTNEVAKTRAENIEYSYDIEDNSLTFSEVLGFDKKDLWRNQSVDVVLRIPVNTVVHFDESLRGVLYDAEIHGRDYYSWTLIEKGSWKYLNKEFLPIDEEGNPIDEEIEDISSDDSKEFRWEDGNTYIEVDEESDQVDIQLFGKEVFKLDVTERDIEGEPKRVEIKVGEKDPIQIEIDEEGEIVEID